MAATSNESEAPSYYEGCSSIAVLQPAQVERTVAEGSRVIDTYDEASKRWTFSERIFARPSGASSQINGFVGSSDSARFWQLPDYLEIDSDVPVNVVTDLRPAGPHRWEMPEVGTHFMLTVCLDNAATSNGPPPVDSASMPSASNTGCAASEQ
jgi:hypothetical protein